MRLNERGHTLAVAYYMIYVGVITGQADPHRQKQVGGCRGLGREKWEGKSTGFCWGDKMFGIIVMNVQLCNYAKCY